MERMTSLAEVVKSLEATDQGINQELMPTTEEEALNCLLRLTEEVESGERGEFVLAANLLQEGQRVPSLSGQFIRNIRSIETGSGLLFVPETIWLRAMDAYIEKLGVPVEFLLENPREGVIKETKTRVFFTRPNLYFKVVREYEPESDELTCLRLEIQYRPPGD